MFFRIQYKHHLWYNEDPKYSRLNKTEVYFLCNNLEIDSSKLCGTMSFLPEYLILDWLTINIQWLCNWFNWVKTLTLISKSFFSICPTYLLETRVLYTLPQNKA